MDAQMLRGARLPSELQDDFLEALSDTGMYDLCGDLALPSGPSFADMPSHHNAEDSGVSQQWGMDGAPYSRQPMGGRPQVYQQQDHRGQPMYEPPLHQQQHQQNQFQNQHQQRQMHQQQPPQSSQPQHHQPLRHRQPPPGPSQAMPAPSLRQPAMSQESMETLVAAESINAAAEQAAASAAQLAAAVHSRMSEQGGERGGRQGGGQDDQTVSGGAETGKKKGGKRTPGDTPRSANSKGLRHFSLKVCEKVQSKQQTTYNEVADELVVEMRTPGPDGPSNEMHYDEKNIRRRVYDALNVLMAMDIITKDRKEISWKGFPSSSEEDLTAAVAKKTDLVKSISEKQAYLQELVEQHASLKGLMAKNQHRPVVHKVPDIIHLPFVLIQTERDAVVEVYISDDMRKVEMDFASAPFQIHDDGFLLRQMDLSSPPTGHSAPAGQQMGASSSVLMPGVNPSSAKEFAEAFGSMAEQPAARLAMPPPANGAAPSKQPAARGGKQAARGGKQAAPGGKASAAKAPRAADRKSHGGGPGMVSAQALAHSIANMSNSNR